MSEAEITLKIGHVEFHARGNQEWLAEQLRHIIELSQSTSVDSNLGEGDVIREISTVEGQLENATAGIKASRWQKQYGITERHLEDVFEQGRNGLEVIVREVPGKTISEKVMNAYLLTGAKALLATDEPIFDDREARSLCEGSGCFDSKTHAKYLKSPGNKFAGSKENGWKLTTPGLAAAAVLVQQISTQ